MRAMLQPLSFAQLQGSAKHAFDSIEMLQQYDVVVAIVDMNLPDIGGIELTANIRKEFPKVQVLAMRTCKERNYISQTIQNAAIG
jgi:DNA-binding NarL/FixJ family response regulator